jgi:hypothetical protein
MFGWRTFSRVDLFGWRTFSRPSGPVPQTGLGIIEKRKTGRDVPTHRHDVDAWVVPPNTATHDDLAVTFEAFNGVMRRRPADARLCGNQRERRMTVGPKLVGVVRQRNEHKPLQPARRRVIQDPANRLDAHEPSIL